MGLKLSGYLRTGKDFKLGTVNIEIIGSSLLDVLPKVKLQ